MRNALRVAVCASAMFAAPACSAIGDIASIITGRTVVSPSADELADAELDVQAFAIIAAWVQMQELAAVVVGLDAAPEHLRAAIHEASLLGTPLMLALAHTAEAFARQETDDEMYLTAMIAEAKQATLRMETLLDIAGVEGGEVRP